MLTTTPTTYKFQVSVGENDTDTSAYVAFQLAEAGVGCKNATKVEFSNISLTEVK